MAAVAQAAPLETSFTRPGEWIGGTRSGGEQWASFAEPTDNPWWPGLSDGLYVEVYQVPGQRPLVWACATRADWARAQLVLAERCATWDAALAAADAWIQQARAFLNDPWQLHWGDLPHG